MPGIANRGQIRNPQWGLDEEVGKPPSHTRGTQGACAAAYSFISTIGVGFVQCVLGAELCRSHLTVWILSWCLTKLVGLQVSSLRNLSVEKEPEGFG